MDNHKTTLALVAAILSLTILMSAVPLADTSNADTIDITQLDFRIWPTSVSYAGELPTLSDNGAVIIVDGEVYQWLPANTYYKPDIIAVDPTEQAFINSLMVRWYEEMPNSYYDFIVVGGPGAFFVNTTANDNWWFTRGEYNSITGWDATGSITAGEIVPPVGPGSILSDFASITTLPTNIDIVAWEVETVVVDGWVFIADLPSSGGTGKDHTLTVAMALAVSLVLSLICAFVGRTGSLYGIIAAAVIGVAGFLITLFCTGVL